MTFLDILKGGWNGLLDLFFPPCCVLCGKLLEKEEKYLCADCLSKLPRTDTAEHRANRLEALFANVDKMLRGAAFCYYTHDSDFRRLIHLVKYAGKAELGEYLGELAGHEMSVSGFFNGIDCLVPVPLHTKRLRRRGFNQAEYICRGLSKATGIPIDTSHLVRLRATSSQTTLNAEERKANMKNAFDVRNPKEWTDKHILLVDDIVTTGATLRECMQKITPIRGCHISVFTLGLAGMQ